MKNTVYYLLYIAVTALFWGGFTFYSAFVVPTGMNVLGNHTTMGFITQEVTIRLNIIGLFWVISAFIVSNNKLNYWVISILILILILFYLHAILSDLMDTTTLTLKPNAYFYTLHRIYLLISTLIWVLVPIHFYKVINRFLRN